MLETRLEPRKEKPENELVNQSKNPTIPRSSAKRRTEPEQKEINKPNANQGMSPKHLPHMTDAP